MKPKTTPPRTPEQKAREEAIRRQHEANPVLERPASAIDHESFAAILSLVARFKAVRESQGLTLAEVADRMGIDAPALSRLETGKTLNPTLGTLHKWAEARGALRWMWQRREEHNRTSMSVFCVSSGIAPHSSSSPEELASFRVSPYNHQFPSECPFCARRVGGRGGSMSLASA